MGSFGRPFYSSTPILAIPSQPAHHASFAPSALVGQSSCADNSSLPEHRIPILSRPLPMGSLCMAGRKRSRDEADSNLMDEVIDLTATGSATEPDDEWEYGEGMVLIKRNRGYVTDASNQSGTWVEEKADMDSVHQAAAAASARVLAQERPVFRSNKSQRLDQGPASSQVMETTVGSDQISMARLNKHVGSVTPLLSEPVVDDFTLHLGIGWRRISDDQHIQAAARGWARYIENHYPISSVNIRLQSSGLQAYLVEAAEGFYLFAEDLKQGRLVSTRAERVLQNLKSSPPVFDGHDVLFAVETPGAGLSGSAPFLTSARRDTDIQMS